MKGKYLINDNDAYTTYGVMLQYESLGALMALPSLKPAIENDSPADNGVELSDTMPKIAKRSITLTFEMWASSAEEAQDNYERFAQMLLSAPFTLTVLRTGITYHLRYRSSTNFVPWFYDRAKYTLSVVEPNPANRD